MPDLFIMPDGRVRTVYSDETVTLLRRCGWLVTRRASHVEPNESGQWVADLSPVGGPTLGPFALRAEALAAESEWLDAALAAGGAKVKTNANSATAHRCR